MKRQDEKKNIVKKLANKAGYPLWDKAKITKGNPYGQRGATGTEDEDQVFIPFMQQDSNSTEAILIVKLTGDDTLYRLQYGSRYTQYGFDTVAHPNLNAKTVFNWFTLFDYSIFGHTDFNVTDSRLLPSDSNDKLRIESVSQVQGRSSINSYTVYVTFMTYTCEPKRGFKGAGSQITSTPTFCGEGYFAAHIAYTTLPVVYYLDDNDTPDNPADDNGWYDENGTFYNSGGGSSICEGCSWADTNPCDMVNGVYITICDETWGPVYNAVIVPFDPSHFDDTIRFENEQYFQDSFPCTYALINAMTNPNSIADSSLFCDFNVSVHNHLAFRIDNTLTQDSVLAQTLPGRSWVDGNNHLHFIDTIELNPYYLEHATKEKVVQFILHESTHAYINFVFEQYKSHEIDSFQVKAIFPNHWEYFRYAQLGGPQTSGSQDHILMSQKYIQRMANEIKRHWSSSATSDQRNIGAEALSWSGLKDDAGWSGVSNNHYIFDTCKITAINWVSENPTASIGVSLSWGCGTYNMPYTDSLKMTTPCK